MKIETKRIDDLEPAPYNPRKDLKPSDPEFEKLKRSIEAFGYVEPIIVNKRTGRVVGGHQRLKVLQYLGHEEAECVVVDLTENQEKALNIALNKVSGKWDYDALEKVFQELKMQNFDLSLTGFDLEIENGDDFFNKTAEERNEIDEEEDEYREFVEKFEAKKTTDDCYTPEIVYDAIADWVSKEYGVSRERFVRPFYPNGDYQSEHYADDAIVVDNPPFSILSEIVEFYDKRKIKFFVFAPALAMFAGAMKHTTATAVCTYAQITYENGAIVQTSFITNLDDPEIIARAVPELTRIIIEADEENQKANKRELPKYAYPDNVCTASMLNYCSKYGVELRIKRKDAVIVSELDAQKEVGKSIYGGGLLLSEKAAAEKAAAEKAAAEKAAAEKAAATRWQLSPRELEIIQKLGENS